MKITWLPHSLNPVFAGVRLRCLIPQAELRLAGQNVSIANEKSDLSEANILIVQGKWLLDAKSPEVLLRRMSRLQAAQSTGTKLVLDSFDNYFMNDSSDGERGRLLEVYRSCLTQFDRLTVSSHGLVPFLRKELSSTTLIDVVGDPLEGIKSHHLYESNFQIINPGRWPSHWRAWRERINVRSKRKTERRLMWFGNHGSHYANGGMSELCRILPSLQDIAARIPIHLTVISNSRHRFEEITAKFDIPRSYREWDRLHFVPLLREQDLVLLPANVTAFTAGKSNNRLLLPLSQGVPVIADGLPDYLLWRDHCAIDEWDKLEQYIAHPTALQQRAHAVAKHLTEEYSPHAIAKQWLAMFRSI